MLTTLRRLSQKGAKQFYAFSTYEAMKEALAKNLYSIDLNNKFLSKKLLAMSHSPGVGAVCQRIQNDPIEAETLTLRARSVAIITDGSFLDATSPAGVGPAMDWIVAQIKYHSGLSPFPFVIEPGMDMEQVLKDFTTSYGTVLLLDNVDIPSVPKDLLVVRHQDVLKLTGGDVTDCEKTANVLGYLISKKLKGLPRKLALQAGLDFEGENFYNYKTYSQIMKDGRDIYTHALELHEYFQGKIQVETNFHDIRQLKPLFTQANLRKISQEKNPYSKTSKLAAIVTNGTAILGYGDIGPRAGLPVMEGKSLLFKLLGDVEVVPLCIYPKENVEEEVSYISKLLGNFEGINLEDIKAPECFAIEEGLNNLQKLPVFHDDQHGTAIVTLAGLINAVKVVDKNLHKCKILINGAGAAGIAIGKLLLHYGVKDIIMCDSKGAIYKGRKEGMNDFKQQIAEVTNAENRKGKLKDVIEGCDIFIGVSQQKALRGHWATKMAKKSIIFALANPIPQILPEDAKAAGAWVYGSARSDFENQINDSLAFPGIFRAITQHRIKKITEEMKVVAAEAIAARIEGQPTRQYIIPESLDKDVAVKISKELGKLVNKARGQQTV